MQRTVLILGAGASAPFGYPIGKGLVNDVLGLLNNQGQSQIIQKLYSKEKIENFKDALLFSAPGSVDSFLESRTEFLELGKLAITVSLIKHENLSQHFDPATQNWYEYLFQKIRNDIHSGRESSFSILTFNYDRSLEAFLHTAFRNYFGMNDKEAKDHMDLLPIVHLYGQTGFLQWQQKNPVRNYKKIEEDYILAQDCSKGIRILSESHDYEKEDAFQKAYDCLKVADRIYFLGFGYGETNLDRLKINTLVKKEVEMSGTGLGFTDLERIQKEILLQKRIDLSYPGASIFNVLSFLRERVSL